MSGNNPNNQAAEETENNNPNNEMADDDNISARHASVEEMMNERFSDDDRDDQSEDAAVEEETTKPRELPNIREAWTTRSVYFPEYLESELDQKMRDLEEKLMDEIDLQKTRHFYPLVFHFGVNNVLETPNSELIEVLEQIDPDLEKYLKE
jgi:hypothetical protein